MLDRGDQKLASGLTVTLPQLLKYLRISVQGKVCEQWQSTLRSAFVVCNPLLERQQPTRSQLGTSIHHQLINDFS